MKWLLVVLFVCGVWGCHGRSSAEPLRRQAPRDFVGSESASAAGTIRTGPLKDHALGAPQQFGALSVFPIFAERDVALGPMTTLERSIAAGKAEVREVGAEVAAAASPLPRHAGVHRRVFGNFAQVNK